MLNSASDYEYLDVSAAANRIHGKIMPVVAPNSTYKDTLHYEDLLFLQEAWHERMDFLSAGTNSISAPPRTLIANSISATELNSASFYGGRAIAGPLMGYRSYRGNYLNKDTTYPKQLVITNYDTTNIDSYLSNYSLSCPETLQPYYSLKPRYKYSSEPLSSHAPSILWSEFIRAKYWAFNNMSKLLVDVCLGDFATRVTHQTFDSSGTISYQYDLGLRESVISYAYAQRDSSGGSYTLFDTDADFKDSFFRCEHAISAVFIYKSHVYNSNASQEKHIWTTLPLTISNNEILVPQDFIHAMVDKALSIANIGANPSVTIGSGLYLLIDFEFPARLNGFDWNWTPQYT